MLMLPRDNFGMDFFDEIFNSPFFNSHSRKAMSTDVKEKDGSYILDMDLPGFEKDDIKIDLNNGYLTVSAEKNNTTKEQDENGKLLRQERYSGHCARSFYVGDSISEEDIKASYKDGILQLTVPKKDSKHIEEKKYIAIE